MSTRGLVVGIVGPESTGKTVLAHALVERVRTLAGIDAVCVEEWLREWCEREGRTPRADEQRAIAEQQLARMRAAAATHALVVADTTPIMTAVYSRLLFGDDSLVPMGVAAQRECDATLMTALDLPWVADGHQRDGEHVREPVQRELRALLTAHGIAWSMVAGEGEARTDAALDAIAPLLRGRVPADSALFTRGAERDARAPRWRGLCEKCDSPECEHLALAALRGRRA